MGSLKKLMDYMDNEGFPQTASVVKNRMISLGKFGLLPRFAKQRRCQKNSPLNVCW
jgi:hypothetical protein